jgi:hypothetical protein
MPAFLARREVTIDTIPVEALNGLMLSGADIVEERSVMHLGIKVRTPDGWSQVTHVCKTRPLPVWRIETRDSVLECADYHLVHLIIRPDSERGGFYHVRDLVVGDLLETETKWSAVTSVEFTGRYEELYDIRVDNENHWYYTNGILSHNSTGIGVAELFKFHLIKDYKALYLAPMKDHVKTFADRLMEIQRASVFPPDVILGRGLRNNLYYKESPSGGSLRLMHILTDPTKVRGQSARTVLIDEAQDFDAEFLPEIEQVQKSFKDLRYTLFAGTSKTVDTCLESQYNLGSGGVWHIPCGCKDKWHSLHDVEAIPNMMSVDGIRCPHNGNLLNPMIGEFVHERPSLLNLRRASFHLPQVIVPEYAAGKAFQDIWTDYKRYPYKKFLQEIMGIATEEGVSELTMDDVKKCCEERTLDQVQADYLSGKDRYLWVFSGCDWGGSDWQPASRTKLSYTVHSMYGVKPDGRVHLLYAKMYAEMNYQEIAGDIVENHLKYKAFGIGADNGGGQYYNAYLRDCGRIPSDRFLVFQYAETRNVLSRIDRTDMHVFSLHRTDSISALINDIKNVKIIFPRWDSVQHFLMHFLNMRRNINETNMGRSTMRYIKHGSKADDFMQSTNYALMLKRIVLRESVIPNQQILDEINSIFGVSVPIETRRAQSILQSLGGHISG